jgi:hypothetical protein
LAALSSRDFAFTRIASVGATRLLALDSRDAVGLSPS